MHRLLTPFLVAFLAAGINPADATDPASDAPDGTRPQVAFTDAASYSQALQVWRSPEDVNAWIGAKFVYDMPRAMLLSENQRGKSGQLPIHPPHAFFAAPSGICVDLSRFAVETLRQIDPDAKARYLMIEFSPVTVSGNTLRMHWVASFVRNGQYHFFADSKRPGHLAGPYDSPAQFIAEYSNYRNRSIVSYRELDSYQRKQRTAATKQARDELRPPAQ